MAKQRKKKKAKNAAVTATSAVGKKKFSLKRALIILFATLAAFILYESVLSLEARAGLSFSIIMPTYFLLCAVLFCLIFFLNRGFSNEEVTLEALTADGVAEEDAERICHKLNRQKALAKKLMMVLLPFLFSIFLDIIYLFYGDFFKGAFEFIAGKH